MRILVIATIASVISGSAAFGGAEVTPWPGDITYKNSDTIQNPMDYSRLNESPIRGKGRIKVVHNEPAPDDADAELTKAMQLLSDNGWQFYKPNSKVGRW